MVSVLKKHKLSAFTGDTFPTPRNALPYGVRELVQDRGEPEAERQEDEDVAEVRHQRARRRQLGAERDGVDRRRGQPNGKQQRGG